MKSADKSGARFTVVVGDSDLETDTINIKNMADGQIISTTAHELVATLQRLTKENTSAS